MATSLFAFSCCSLLRRWSLTNANSELMRSQIEAEAGRELELAHELCVDKLPLEPGRVLLHEIDCRLLALADGKARLLDRVAHVEVGPAQLVVAEF